VRPKGEKNVYICDLAGNLENDERENLKREVGNTTTLYL
jgi:hypothetical protein